MKGRNSKSYDDASDPQVTGISFWYVDGIFDGDGCGKMVGKAELIDLPYLLISDFRTEKRADVFLS